MATELAPNGKEKVGVKIANEDGNAFAILSRCRTAMHREGWTQQEVKAFTDTAMSRHSYDDLLSVVLDYCNDEQDDDREMSFPDGTF